MKIGYACLAIGVENTDFKTCILKNASKERLYELIEHNLNSLMHIIDYNMEHNIRMFRISSDLIPFASNPVNTLHWWDLFETKFKAIGNKIKQSGMRVSMHPGQYTVLNSPNEEIVKRATLDLLYHARILDSLGVDSKNKIILHIGGVYQNKEEAMCRFICNYEKLDDNIKQRLVIENDDKSYHIEDVLQISNKTGIPVVFDNLHNKVNKAPTNHSEEEWILKCRKTWKATDGCQKMHFSQQDEDKQPGSHSATISIEPFIRLVQKLGRDDIDIMLEVKDKNLSALKCNYVVAMPHSDLVLKNEWSKYEYVIKERAPLEYRNILEMLSLKDEVNLFNFYQQIEVALQREASSELMLSIAMEIWNKLADKANQREHQNFLQAVDKMIEGKGTIDTVKKCIYKVAHHYHVRSLLNSYYFIY